MDKLPKQFEFADLLLHVLLGVLVLALFAWVFSSVRAPLEALLLPNTSGESPKIGVGLVFLLLVIVYLLGFLWSMTTELLVAVFRKRDSSLPDWLQKISDGCTLAFLPESKAWDYGTVSNDLYKLVEDELADDGLDGETLWSITGFLGYESSRSTYLMRLFELRKFSLSLGFLGLFAAVVVGFAFNPWSVAVLFASWLSFVAAGRITRRMNYEAFVYGIMTVRRQRLGIA
ncbi:MAG: hypothetical protein AAGI53_07915 [Planctomycetota bacterium]